MVLTPEGEKEDLILPIAFSSRCSSSRPEDTTASRTPLWSGFCRSRHTAKELDFLPGLKSPALRLPEKTTSACSVLGLFCTGPKNLPKKWVLNSMFE